MPRPLAVNWMASKSRFLMARLLNSIPIDQTHGEKVYEPRSGRGLA